MGAIVVGFGNEHFGRAAQISLVRRGGIGEFLGGPDAVLFKHDDEHFRVYDRTRVEELHRAAFRTAARCCTNWAMMLTAISGTLIASIGNPTGQATLFNCSSV